MVFFIVGCAEVTEGPETVQFMPVVQEFFEEEPLEGVEVCQTGTANCETTNAGGSVTIELPANESVSWTLERDGYGSTVMGDVTDPTLDPARVLYMFSDERLTEEFGRLPTPYPPRDTGALFIATFPLSAGVTFTLKDATGNGYYLDEGRRMQWSLEATTAAGAGGFVEVGPGDVQVEVGGAAERCSPGAAWPGNDSNRISMPVRDGYITYATVICPVP